MAISKTVERNMFYKATPDTFENARYLRKNMTPEENLLWEKLRKKQLGLRFKAQHPIEHFIVDSCLPAGRFIVIKLN